jgi:hypothetical protein
MGNIQELKNSWLRQKLKKREKSQTLTENLISKYQGKLWESQFRKKTDQRTLQLCFMKSSVQAIR